MIRSLLLATALTLGGVVAPTGVMGASPTARALDHSPWRLPVTPPRCSVADADSGDVADCLLAFYDDPADTGWGLPPAPGVGSGWEWSGYWYNGSPALASWEASTIGANDHTVAGLAAGRLETHVAAQALFEGFLDEIAANGYRVRDASGYSFRCTNGNGGWSCPSGDPSDLSNHAWGLAIDMNAGTNPIRSYAGIGGQTACATPIETDLPRWVIRTAEKWGLYWGGYGWSNGCADTTTQRTIVYTRPTALRVPRHARPGQGDRRVQPPQRPRREVLRNRLATRAPTSSDAPHRAVPVPAGACRSTSTRRPVPWPHWSTSQSPNRHAAAT